jgi:hypothetical protein
LGGGGASRSSADVIRPMRSRVRKIVLSLMTPLVNLVMLVNDPLRVADSVPLPEPEPMLPESMPCMERKSVAKEALTRVCLACGTGGMRFQALFSPHGAASSRLRGCNAIERQYSRAYFVVSLALP